VPLARRRRGGVDLVHAALHLLERGVDRIQHAKAALRTGRVGVEGEQEVEALLSHGSLPFWVRFGCGLHRLATQAARHDLQVHQGIRQQEGAHLAILSLVATREGGKRIRRLGHVEGRGREAA
jgi:hypothetical protein